MQKYIDFIFNDVWCKAIETKEYGISLFSPIPSLYGIMEDLYRQDLAGTLKDGSGKWFYESVNDIFNEFKMLSLTEISILKAQYSTNNNIQMLCSGTGSAPTRYTKKLGTNVCYEKLHLFFFNLYSSNFWNLSLVRNTIGATFDTYYEDFVTRNAEGCCPFCGLFPIDSANANTREAFDHYLPKDKYLFNSINLENLFPACHKCNSGNKGVQDPLYDSIGRRRKAFFPFTSTYPVIDVTVEITGLPGGKITQKNVSIGLASSSHPDEVRTWDELYHIQQRYSDRCSNTSGGLAWLNRVFSEAENYHLSTKDMFDAEVKSAKKKPWHDSNFLKAAFLEGCERFGII